MLRDLITDVLVANRARFVAMFVALDIYDCILGFLPPQLVETKQAKMSARWQMCDRRTEPQKLS